WDEIGKEPPDNPAHQARRRDPLALIYTSGTTGESKAVVMPHGQLLFGVEQLIQVLTSEHWRRTYVFGPFFHIFGLLIVVSVMATGSKMHLVRRFSRTQFWNDVRRWDITTVGLTGSMFQILLSNPPDPMDSQQPIKRLLGGFLTRDVQLEFERRFGLSTANVY